MVVVTPEDELLLAHLRPVYWLRLGLASADHLLTPKSST